MIFILPIIIGITLNKHLNRKNLTLLIGLMYTIISSLRSVHVGYDTMSYYHRFTTSEYMTFDGIFREYADEPSYYLLCKIVNLCGGDFQILLLIIGILSMFAVSRLIYKYSPSIVTSFAMLVPLQYYGFMLSAERQTIAISLVLLGVQFIFNRQLIKYLICIVIAYSFHNSVIVAFPLYFCFIKTLDSKKRFLALLLIPILYAAKSTILNYGLSLMYSDYSAYDNEQGSYVTLVLYFTFWVLYILTKPKETNSMYNFFEATAIIGIIIQLFVPLEPNIFRVAFYYQIFNIVLLPIAISNIKKNFVIKNIGYVTTIVILAVMYFVFTFTANGVNPYTFFWEVHI